jgi:hypothetical protein
MGVFIVVFQVPSALMVALPFFELIPLANPRHGVCLTDPDASPALIWTACRQAALMRSVENGIGVLNEGPLHRALKTLYCDGDAVQEVAVGNYVADVRGADCVLYEIQTGNFSGIKRKLGRLVEDNRVVLVHPIAQVRYIVKQHVDADTPVSRRRSPKKGSIAHVLDALVSIPRLLNHPNFELEVVLIAEEEYRVPDPGRWRKKGWRVASRRLLEVLDRQRFSSAEDLLRLAPGELPEVFTTLDLAEMMARPRELAQKLAYCLREAGVVEVCGKKGNALRYRRAGKVDG